MSDETLSTFLELARGRRSTRHFTDDPLPEGMMEHLLDAARWAPSGYNLQSTHFVVVTDQARREALRPACMHQRQITDAPAVVVFAGDKAVMRAHMERVIEMDRDAGATNEKYEALMRKMVPLAMDTGPMGVGWLWKATLAPLAGWFTPMPSIPAVRRRYWLAKQAALCTMSFMLAAEAAGLATCPMEGFDEWRVRRVLGIPRRYLPIIVTPVGYAATSDQTKTRLPMDQLVHYEQW